MQNMKRLSSAIQSEDRISGGLQFVWTMLVVAWFGILLWPSQNKLPLLEEQTISKLTVQERQSLIGLQTQALRAEPLDPSGLTNLALLHASIGDHLASDRFFELAAARSVRNFLAQSNVITRLVDRGQIAQALVQIDGVLRAQGSANSQVFLSLLVLAQRKDGLVQLVTLLASGPPWRQKFLSFASGDHSHSEVLYTVFAEMRARRVAIADGEIRAYLSGLIDQKKIDKAYFVWLDLLYEKQLRLVKLLYDGDFSSQFQGLFFDWNVKNVQGVRVAQVVRAGSMVDHSLMLDFAAAKPSSNLIEQTVLLQPGNYSLQGEVNAKNFVSEDELQWQMRCIEKTVPLGLLPHRAGSAGWARVEANFTVPPEDCNYQKLVLRFAAPVLHGLSGQIYFDKLRVVKRP